MLLTLLSHLQDAKPQKIVPKRSKFVQFLVNIS